MGPTSITSAILWIRAGLGPESERRSERRRRTTRGHLPLFHIHTTAERTGGWRLLRLRCGVMLRPDTARLRGGARDETAARDHQRDRWLPLPGKTHMNVVMVCIYFII